ncbi:MAG: hypothetical protein AAF962_12900 [Actinomycetota bacterium]
MKRLIWCVLGFSLVVASCAGRIGQAGPERSSRLGDDGIPSALAFAEPIDELATLRLALTRPSTVHPAEVSMADQSAVIVSDLLYDGLTEVAGGDDRLRPALASSWRADETYTTWWFEIDEDRIDPAVVVDHFNAVLTTERSAAASVLLDGIDSVAATSGGTIEFTLSDPDGGFPWLLSGLAASVVGADGDPTGRYRTIDEVEPLPAPAPALSDDGVETDGAVPDESGLPGEVALQAVDPSAVGPDTIEIRWATDDIAAYELLTLGLADAAVAPPTLLDDAAQRFGHRPTERSITVFYGLSLPGADVADRRAVVDAIDAAAESGMSTELVAIGAAPSALLVGGSLAGADLLDPSAALDAGRDGDDAAPSAETGPDLGDVVVSYTDPAHTEVAEALSERLRAAGMSAIADQRAIDAQASAIAEGRAGVFAFGWAAAAGSLDAVVAPLGRSSSAANVLGFASADVDAVLVEAASTGDDRQRWALLAEAYRLLTTEARAVPVGVANSLLVVAPPAEGLVVRSDGSLDLEAQE